MTPLVISADGTLLPYTPEYIFPYNFNIPPNKIHDNDIKKMEYINEQLTCYMRLKKITFNCFKIKKNDLHKKYIIPIIKAKFQFGLTY